MANLCIAVFKFYNMDIEQGNLDLCRHINAYVMCLYIIYGKHIVVFMFDLHIVNMFSLF